MRLNFDEYFTRIYDRRKLYKRLLVGESLDALCPYSRTSRGSTVSSGATRVLVMGITLLLSKGLTLTNSCLIWFDFNPSINQFAYELALEQLPQGRLKLSYSWLHILTNNLVPQDGVTLNLEMSRQSSVVDLEISELLIRISNL